MVIKMSMEVPDSIRTIREDQFNQIQWGYLPKSGQIMESGQTFNWREMDFIEANTPGLDAATFTKDIKYLIPEVLNRQIITVAEARRIGRSLIEAFRINGPNESFLKEYGFQAAQVPEGGEIPVAKVSHEKMYINVFKVGVRPLLTYEAIADGQFGILERNTRQAVLAMVKWEDAHIMTVLNAGVPDGSDPVGTNELDHSFASGDTSLTWELWVQAMMSIEMENLTGTDGALHPYQASQILKLPEYRDLSGAASWNIFPERASRVVQTGQLPPILGLNLWVTRNQTTGTILIVDRGNYGILAERQPLLVESEKDIIRQMQTVVYSQRYGAGILNNDGGANITGLKLSI